MVRYGRQHALLGRRVLMVEFHRVWIIQTPTIGLPDDITEFVYQVLPIFLSPCLRIREMARGVPVIPFSAQRPRLHRRKRLPFAPLLSAAILNPGVDLGQPFAVLCSGEHGRHWAALEKHLPAPAECVAHVFRNALARLPTAVSG